MRAGTHWRGLQNIDGIRRRNTQSRGFEDSIQLCWKHQVSRVTGNISNMLLCARYIFVWHSRTSSIPRYNGSPGTHFIPNANYHRRVKLRTVNNEHRLSDRHPLQLHRVRLNMYMYHFLFFRRAALRRPRVLSRTFGCGACKGTVGTLQPMSGSRPRTVAVLGALNAAELTPKNKGFLSASPSRVGDLENGTFFFFLFRK